MFFTHLKLVNFRNYEKLSIDFHEKINVITGDNGQGKTNLLEALYITSLGKSFRTNKDSDMIKFNEDLAFVKSSFFINDDERNIEIAIKKRGKSIKVDNNKVNTTKELVNKAYIVAFTPDDLRIVKDEPEKRRRFMDRELCQLSPIYYGNLQRYKKALVHRNFILKKDSHDDNLMDVWEKQLADYGSKIIKDRQEFIKKLKVISQKIHKDISQGKEELVIEYEASPIDEEILKNERSKDIFRGNTSVGPHRDDISLKINGIDVRKYGSQGQQRTAALSLKLSEIELIKEEKNEWPVLLLDDVLSELDEGRQEFLLNSLFDVQLFITSAEIKEGLFGTSSDNNTYTIREGKIV